MAQTSPDPVTQGAAYQRSLLSLLGDDDPAEVQEGTTGRLHKALKDAGSALRERPEPKEWSVLELLGHIADAELVMSVRYRWVLSHERPPIAGYDQDRWVERLRHNNDEPAELLEIFTPLRAANLQLWRRSSAADRARVGLHSERGEESYDLMFRMIAGHDRFHLNQMQATLRHLR
jgi:hypothetical protein